MDRNTIIGMLLIAGVVLTWTVFFSGDDEKTPNEPTKKEVVTGGGNVVNPSTVQLDTASHGGITDSAWSALSDSAKQAVMASDKRQQHGDFAGWYEGEDKVIEVETDVYKVELHTLGARIGKFELKNYKTSDSLPLPIQLDNPENYFSLSFTQIAYARNPIVNSREIHFQAPSTQKVTLKGEETISIPFRAQLDGSRYLEFVYTFKGSGYDYGLVLRQAGLGAMIQNQRMGVEWKAEIPKTEKAMRLMREKTRVYYREANSVEELSALGHDKEEPTKPEAGVDWVAFHSQFFTHTLMTKEAGTPINNLSLSQVAPLGPDGGEETGEVVAQMQLNYDLAIATKPVDSVAYTFFAGPLDYNVLKAYDRDMTGQISLGWWILGYINRYMTIPVFTFLEGFIGNYGLIILLLGLFFKTLIYPLTYRMYISTSKMRLVNNMPEVKELDLKYKDDPTKLTQEKQVYYRKYGVSMLGGCWPMLIQYPFLIALFAFFPNSIELRQQSFLWAPDLSTYDSILDLPFSIPAYGSHVSLFTLLMTLSIFAYTIINQRLTPQTVNNPVMKWFPYIMPIILLGFLNRYPAGLSWYYLLSNLISISQTLITRMFVSDQKLLDKLKAYAKDKGADPNRKKGTLERWAERQQERQRDMVEARQQQRGEGGGPSGQPKRGEKYTPKKRR